MRNAWAMATLLFVACSNPSPTVVAGGTASPTPTVTAAPSPETSPSPTAMLPSGNYGTAADAGVAGVAAKTGFGTSAKPCPPDCQGQPQVFGNSDPSSGLDAAYVQIAPQGSGNGTVCYAYVYYDSAGWHYTVPVVCPRQAGTNPVLGGSDHVNVPGSCANVRQGPALTAKIVTCLSNGTAVHVDSLFPRYADGHIWWSINNGQGWMAHDFLITP